jgi:hypothetical protein
MSKAQTAVREDKVVDIGCSFSIQLSGGATTSVNLLLSDAHGLEPVIYLAVDQAFLGAETPYNTRDLPADSLLYGIAVDELLKLSGVARPTWIWAADWETVPALLLLQRRHLTALHLHNVYDQWLGSDVAMFDRPEYEVLHHVTTLQAGMRSANVIAAVNRGFAFGLRTEPIYTHVLAPHLQGILGGVVPVENGNFEVINDPLLALGALLKQSIADGAEAVRHFRTEARSHLPSELRNRLKGRALVVIMGRRVVQKLHEVAVGAARAFLKSARHSHASAQVFFFFATTPGEDTGSEVRLEQIKELAEEFPDACSWSDGRLDYFDNLMRSADFNLLTSLYEPHGGALQSAVVPIVRAIDGLAVQIPSFEPSDSAFEMHKRWHGSNSEPAGFSYREPFDGSEATLVDLQQMILSSSPVSVATNLTARAMIASCEAEIRKAVEVWIGRPKTYARLVCGAINAQTGRSWTMNYGAMFSHIAAAATRNASS